MNVQYLRDRQAAEYLSVAVSTIWQWAREKKIKPIKLSPKVTVWAKADLDAFIQSRTEV